MKYIFVLFFSLVLYSCTSNTDPKQVALDYLNARNQMDWEKAKKYANPATDTTIDRMSSIMSLLSDSINSLRKSAKVEIQGEADIDGNTATVNAFNIIHGKKTPEPISLIKTEEGWLVNDPWEFSSSMIAAPEEADDSTSNEETVQVDPNHGSH